MKELNEFIIVVMDRESYTKEELKSNAAAAYSADATATAYSADATAYSAAAAYAVTAAADAVAYAAADYWVDTYLELTGENKQDYIDEIARRKAKTSSPELVSLKITKTQCHMLTQLLKKDCHIALRNYIYREMHKENKMDKFDLKRALAGDKVITRRGQEVNQLVVFKTNSGDALYGLNVDSDRVEQRLIDGRYSSVKRGIDSDLFMAPKKLSGFVNVTNYFEMPVYKTREEADKCASSFRIACIDLSQFEEGHGLSKRKTYTC
jgi:hypothetical protein